MCDQQLVAHATSTAAILGGVPLASHHRWIGCCLSLLQGQTSCRSSIMISMNHLSASSNSLPTLFVLDLQNGSNGRSLGKPRQWTISVAAGERA